MSWPSEFLARFNADRARLAELDTLRTARRQELDRLVERRDSTADPVLRTLRARLAARGTAECTQLDGESADLRAVLDAEATEGLPGPPRLRSEPLTWAHDPARRDHLRYYISGLRLLERRFTALLERHPAAAFTVYRQQRLRELQGEIAYYESVLARHDG